MPLSRNGRRRGVYQIKPTNELLLTKMGRAITIEYQCPATNERKLQAMEITFSTINLNSYKAFYKLVVAFKFDDENIVVCWCGRDVMV